MITIEASTLEEAYTNAAATLECSVAELDVKIFQVPSKGIFGLFKKKAIIVAAIKKSVHPAKTQEFSEQKESSALAQTQPTHQPKSQFSKPQTVPKTKEQNTHPKQKILNDTIMPVSFVSDQDDDAYEDLKNPLEFTADYDDIYDEESQTPQAQETSEKSSTFCGDIYAIVEEVSRDVNALFASTCFNIDEIGVSVWDDETLLLEFQGEDAALLIGKEGYRYKALSYMLFNWLSAKYDVGLRLEIAEFLKNQEESMARYLVNVYESIERDGRAQTKILDGVLVQIALKELRERYPQKYVVIRSTKEGLKYIIINDYHI